MFVEVFFYFVFNFFFQLLTYAVQPMLITVFAWTGHTAMITQY